MDQRNTLRRMFTAVGIEASDADMRQAKIDVAGALTQDATGILLDPQLGVGAVLGADVEIGPFCLVGSHARLGDGVRLLSHVIVTGNTEIGARIHVLRIVFQPRLVPGDRVDVLLAVEIRVGQLHGRAGVGRIARENGLQRLHLRVVEFGRLLTTPRCGLGGGRLDRVLGHDVEAELDAHVGMQLHLHGVGVRHRNDGEDSAIAALDGVGGREAQPDVIADLQAVRLTGHGEFAQRNAAFALEANVDDGLVVFDCRDGALDHAAFKAAVGSAAPEIALPDDTGAVRRLSDQRGRWVVPDIGVYGNRDDSAKLLFAGAGAEFRIGRKVDYTQIFYISQAVGPGSRV